MRYPQVGAGDGYHPAAVEQYVNINQTRPPTVGGGAPYLGLNPLDGGQQATGGNAVS